MSTTTVSGTGKRNDGGSILHAGNIASSRWDNITLATTTIRDGYGSRVRRSHWTGVESALKGSAVAITAITESGSTGFCNIEKSTNGLSVGDVLYVSAADVAYNTTHIVTVDTDGDNVQTDIPYISDTVSAHGNYKVLNGTFAVMATEKFISRYIAGGVLAGVANTIMSFPASDYHRVPIHKTESARKLAEDSWDYVTGAVTKGSTAGDSYDFIDPAIAGGVTASTDSAANPTRAIPGELVYRDGSPNPVQDDYKAITG